MDCQAAGQPCWTFPLYDGSATWLSSIHIVIPFSCFSSVQCGARLVPLEYYDLGAPELQRVNLFPAKPD